MCGICGVLNISGSIQRNELYTHLKKMADSIRHRGPDDEGVWVSPDNSVAFSHRRLSIIDTSSAGHQPMQTSDHRFTITFNGEIYNYLEIRKDLEARGAQLRTRTDTEVILEAFRAYGLNAFDRFDGMYALAIHDAETKTTTLARDPFGEKPLYYTAQAGYFAFASELHALTLLPNFDASLDQESIAQYFAFQYVPSPRTIYRTVKKLPPGHTVTIQNTGETAMRRFFTFAPEPKPHNAQPIAALADELEDILTRSIQRRMISDVPLGAFLSGGVDSSTVVALITKKLGKPIKTFSIGFTDAPESEHILAREMAEHLGADHHEKMLRPHVLPLATHIGSVLDEPNSDSSCLPTYLLSQFAREHVTVCLSGDGGDEMFGGYGRYFQTVEESINPPSPDWTPGGAYFSGRLFIFPEPYLERLLGYIPPETKMLLQLLKSEVNDPTLPLLSRLRKNDVDYYMPGAVLAKVDRMSMQHALEVRCPLLSIEIARFAEKLTVDQCYSSWHGKLVLKELAARYIPREWLDRSKKGFGLPTNLWGKELFLKQLRSQTTTRGAMAQHWIGKDNILRFVHDQEAPNQFSTYQTWALLIFEQWLRTHAAGLSNGKRPKTTLLDYLPFFKGSSSASHRIAQ